MNVQSETRSPMILAAFSGTGLLRDGDREQEVRFSRRAGRPVPGDRVRVDAEGVVTEILPRDNLFQRGAWGGKPKPVAANLDHLLILVAPEPYPSRDLVHRYLAAAFILGIPPTLVHTKTDLAGQAGDRLAAHLDEFDHLGLARHAVAAETGDGLDRLRDNLAGKAALMVGQSGVGKSSLLNRLVPTADSRTAELSRVTGKGTHATTSCQLHEFPGGGWLGDTPGVWEFSLWAMPATELEHGFPEFAGIEARCKFRDCRHLDEPGCAIRAAAGEGMLPPGRYQVWKRLVGEQERLRREG